MRKNIIPSLLPVATTVRVVGLERKHWPFRRHLTAGIGGRALCHPSPTPTASPFTGLFPMKFQFSQLFTSCRQWYANDQRLHTFRFTVIYKFTRRA